MTSTKLSGLYKVPEAARYLYVTSRLPSEYPKPTPQYLIMWMRQGLASTHLINISGHHVTIDFEDLISMRVIYLLHGMGVSIKKIREARDYLSKLTGHSHPFATEKLWTETIDIFTEIGPLLITASKYGQLPFIELVKRDLVNIHDMTFSHGVADSWAPQAGIMLKPNIQFGAPCIANTGIPTYSIWRMYLGGDNKDFLSYSYQVAIEQIEQAIKWEDNLAQITFSRPTSPPDLLGG